MTQITAYTDTDAIRACLGVDSHDAGDDLIVNSNLELELTVDLDVWLSTHATVWSDGNASGASIEEKLHRNYLVLYSQWFCAYELASRFLTFPQIVTDGKNQINRFANVELEKVQALAADRMAKYRGLLDEAVNGTVTASIPVVTISSPTLDPVTTPDVR